VIQKSLRTPVLTSIITRTAWAVFRYSGTSLQKTLGL
jgi:hypothetical protein